VKVLGLDPGATTGWCLYVDTELGRYVEACGEFREHMVPQDVLHRRCDHVVIERPKGYGPTRPQVVDCGYVCGRLVEQFALVHAAQELTRLEVCQALTEATCGVVRVKNDGTAWAALVLLHGDDSARKPKRRKGVVVDAGGPLGLVTGHARAALAVAVAFVLRRGASVA
jgi:hypothetical protein